MSKPLILVDGSSYFFRAFHALPPLTNSKGQPTGAIYGVANMIKRLIKTYDPILMAVVFDAKGKTFRDDLYSAYKANRPPMPEDLRSQFKPLVEVLKAMGLPILTIEGVEADDVIGTLCAKAIEQDQDIVVSTGDKDMAQLVNERVTLINTMTDKTMDVLGVEEKFGVKPHQIIDYLALMGDKSDNIPGVPKCGPKTAAKWLSDYETLENLINHADDIGGKIGDNLRASLTQLELSKALVTIKKDVALPVSLTDLKIEAHDNNRLIELTRTYEFKSWLKELLEKEQGAPFETNASQQTQTFEFDIITEKTELDDVITKLLDDDEICLDTETTSLDAIKAEIVGLSFRSRSVKATYIPLTHSENTVQLNREETLEALRPILESSKIRKIGQNLKYDYTVFCNHGIKLQAMDYDTMLESYVLNSTVSRHDMDSLALKYLGKKTISYKDVAGSGAKQLRFDDIPIDKAAPYAAEDAAITYELHQTLYPMLEDSLKTVFHDIEMPLMAVLANMEQKGVLIDEKTLEKQGLRLEQEIDALQEEAYEITGRPFNLNSPKQLLEILFHEQKLPILAKTPKGQPSTAEAVLQELALEYRLPAIILRHRSLSKLVSTYIHALPKRIQPKTGRVHTSYNQAVAATGRLSSSEPNLQNIPIRTEEGRMIRQAFIAPENHVLLALDYSQIELRIMAHLSKDESLLHAFANDLDIHTATASEIFDVSLESVTDNLRRRAKAVNFGLIYGMSAFGLAKQIGVERSEAQSYIDRYFKRYPGVLDYMERTRKKAHHDGYVETVFGRRLHLPEINSKNHMRKLAAERTAINAPMQGTAADIIKKSMIAVSQWIEHEKPDAAMIMQVHDELIFEVQKDCIDSVLSKVKHIMEHTVELSVPLKVSAGTGKNWDEAH